MEDLNKLLELTDAYPLELERMTQDFLLKLKVILWGQAAVTAANNEKQKDITASVAASPQHSKKRVKRLSSLTEDNEAEMNIKQKSPSPVKSRKSNAELLATVEGLEDGQGADLKEVISAPVAAPRTQISNNEDVTDLPKDNGNIKSDASSLMPPPPALIITPADETLNRRPQRAAKLKSEKNLKEPKLSGKLRRPTNIYEIKIKLEHEHRASQMHESKKIIVNKSNPNKDTLSSQNTDDSVVVIPGKNPSIVSINSEIDETSSVTSASNASKQTETEHKKSVESGNDLREVRVKIKREKLSIQNQEDIPSKTPLDDAVFKAPEALSLPLPLVVKNETTVVEEVSNASSLLSATTNTTTTAGPTKKLRKKKELHRPIKVERFSDLDPKHSPISTRTRSGNEVNRPASVYEDAIEPPTSRNSKEINNATATVGAVNETINLGPASDATMNLGAVPGDATFCNNPAQATFQVAPGQTTFTVEANPNATITLNKHSGALADATFDVQQMPKTVKEKNEDNTEHRSFETAIDSSMAPNESLLTEDDSTEPEKVIPNKAKITAPPTKAVAASKPAATAAKPLYKMPTRTNELFNPLAQSPVKMRVEAFENAAAAATAQTKRPLRSRKENVTPSSNTTPVIGKLPAPALGRFLTPTQSSNITAVSSAIAKKGTISASKAMPMAKSVCASSLQRSNSATSTKTLHRENSVDDFRKGLHSLAEERKKQREQKHLLAAQQREAKERERAERMAKLAKEREEKRLLKKQQEKDQKKKELEEIQRKLQQQQEEEAAKLKAAKEREMLLQMKQQQQLAKQKMMPPPPKVASKYTFEMLHEDDSTDDEDKVSYKRPPPPSWSRSFVRGPNMLKQEYTPSAYIDSFFSVQPMTPDLKVIFPNIDARHLKRNSSVLWSTPPRYSELPKY